MALQHSLGPISGSYKSPRMIITVWDDAGATLDHDDAVDYAATIAPLSIFGSLQDPDPGVTELAGHIYAIDLGYTRPEQQEKDQPPQRETSTLARRMNFQAQSKLIYTCLEPIGVYSPDGDVTDDYSYTKWLVNVQGKGFDQFRTQGLTVEPLPETRTLDYYIPNTDVTDAYCDALEELCGKFNSGPFFDRPQGSVQLVRASLSERSPSDWELSLGFGYRAPQESLSVASDIVIPELRGSWIYWTREREEIYDAGGTTGKILEIRSDIAVVQRVWEEDDFSTLSLPAVTYPEGE